MAKKTKQQDLDTFINDQKKIGKNNSFVGIAILILIAGFYFIKYNFGVKQPGAFFEKADYTVKVYIFAKPDPNSSKSYYIPADVMRSSGDSGYTIETMYWPEGGSTDFSDCSNLQINQFTDCLANDNNMTDYSIMLTNTLAH
ncbi:MAG TPA: hypothetical protein VNE40_00115 [Candidatus Dormibacteraeota bacterium]|nr:hypothetical protein [Candidatus Dormibacteraeota bacterium]